MGTNDTYDPFVTPDPDSTSPEQPLLIVPATEPPGFPPGFPDDLAPTVVVHETYAPTNIPPDVPHNDDRRPAWPYVAAVVALLVGGLAGYLLGVAGDDDATAPPATVVTAPAATVAAEPATDATLDMLLARTQADGEYKSPSDYAQLDEITAIDNAKATEELRAQLDLLTVAREDATGLADRVAELETAVADVTAERDALVTDDGIASVRQAELDAANATMDELTDDLTEANTNLAAANATIVERDAAVTTLQGQLEDLDVRTVDSYVDADVTKARNDARANGWTIIEQPTVSATSPAGVVLEQAPPVNSNMVTGSVLYVKVATRS